jgi:2-amino-4-hydroxy-6-hydroxymethyldihydropteridine diphosphokinase
VTLAYVGVGSNQDGPIGQVEAALRELDRIPDSRLVGRSSLYRTAPVGHADQPDFTNAVAALETSLAPEALLDELLDIETAHGRQRSFANAPRSLDLDLLLYGQSQLETARLIVPHPRMCERAFVLRPLLELAEDISIPGKGAARDLLQHCERQDVQRMA